MGSDTCPATSSKGSPGDWNVQPGFGATGSDPDAVSPTAERQGLFLCGPLFPRARFLSCLPEL